jgi:hypothetical protein
MNLQLEVGELQGSYKLTKECNFYEKYVKLMMNLESGGRGVIKELSGSYEGVIEELRVTQQMYQCSAEYESGGGGVRGGS